MTEIKLHTLIIISSKSVELVSECIENVYMYMHGHTIALLEGGGGLNYKHRKILL
jgi:hypothetical protein